jgi:hypothetical protein
MYRSLVAATLFAGGCALVSSASPDSTQQDFGVVAADMSQAGDLAEGIIVDVDMAHPPKVNDAGMVVPIVDMSKPPPPGADLAKIPCSAAEHLVINEVLINGSGGSGDEFVEIYNPCSTDSQPIGGFKLLHRSTSGTSDQPTLTIPAGTKNVDPNGYFLVAGPNYSGATPYDIQYSSAMLASGGGGLALDDGGGKRVDAMGWGSTATNAYVVGKPAASPPDGKSLARTPNGSSSNGSDALDFATATPSPRAPN